MNTKATKINYDIIIKLMERRWCVARGEDSYGFYVEAKEFDHQGKKVRQRFYTEERIDEWMQRQGFGSLYDL